MMTPSGDIWMLPISLDASAIWYVPENLEKFDIRPEELLYLDDFLKLSERMPKEGFPAAYVDSAINFADQMLFQYDMTYNNFKEKKVNYVIPLYKALFEKMWGGWTYKSPKPRHPLFRNSQDDYQGELITESAPYDKSRVIYKHCGIGKHLNMSSVSLEGWRVLPVPRITPDIKNNYVSMYCAFINPYSKNKELALEHLEAITKVPFDFWLREGVLLFKGKEMYEERYDITQPAFEDIYNIMKNGDVSHTGGFFPSLDIIDDYQNDRLTLDEAITAIQREAEMWLNE
jgi:ABC-type glycerol-3-phosphate transport system substrate-binding protein